MSKRDKLIDGFRGVAALCVVFSHAVSYRYSESIGKISVREFSDAPTLSGAVALFADKLAGPLAELGVRLFFVISGYIITSLLLTEEARDGTISIPAFYARRTFRILPPLWGFLAACVFLRWIGWISFNNENLLASALFICNTGLNDCGWWFAHTWSLAVEEQFYLFWPLLLILTPVAKRPTILAAAMALLTGLFFWLTPTFHSNFISFDCIAVGALCAASANLRSLIQKYANGPLFSLAVALLIFGPLVRTNIIFKMIDGLTPLLACYVIFAAPSIALVAWALRSLPLQIVGLGSYSLYLWQQLFFGRPELYGAWPLNPILLIPVVLSSLIFIEHPFQRVGRMVSAALKARRTLNESQASIP